MNVKKLTVIGMLCLSSIAVSIGYQQMNVDKVKSAVSLKSGLGTCFERVSQSFTALMTKNIKSSYLSQAFLTTTSECISDANTVLGNISDDVSKKSAQLLNQFGSDYYWFSQKALKLKTLISSSDVNLESSNIVQKYFTLDDLRSNFSIELTKSVDRINKKNTQLLFVAAISFGAFLLSFITFSFIQRKRDLFIRKLDVNAKDLLSTNIEKDKAERLIKDLFYKLKTKNIDLLYNQINKELSTLDDIPVVTPIPKVKSTNLSDSISKHLEALNSKISSYAIHIDMKNVKNFNVKGSEELVDQIVFHALNYACDFSKEERVKLNTSLLGGTAIFKIKLNKHCFNSDELDYLNNSKQINSTVNLDLRLLKELTENLEGSFAVRNNIDTTKNITQSEFEFIFSVPSIRKTTTTKIMKGSKKDILRQMSSEA